MNPQEFAEKWSKSELKETAGYISHFEDLCRLMEHPTPAEKDPKGDSFTYQAGIKKAGNLNKDTSVTYPYGGMKMTRFDDMNCPFYVG